MSILVAPLDPMSTWTTRSRCFPTASSGSDSGLKLIIRYDQVQLLRWLHHTVIIKDQHMEIEIGSTCITCIRE